MTRVVIVAYEVADVEGMASLVGSLDYTPTGCREVFRQATGDHVLLDRAFVVAARSFDAPAVSSGVLQ